MEGVIVPTLTALTDKGEFDKPSQDNLFEYLAESKINGIFGLGYTGEYLFLPHRIRLQALKATAELADKYNLYCALGVTGDTIEQTLYGVDITNSFSADAIVLQLSRFQHPESALDKVLQRSTKHVYLYANRHTALDKKEVITPENIQSFAQKTAGLKISDDFENLEKYCEALKGTDYPIYIGNAFDLQRIDELNNIEGVIVGDGNVFPKQWVQAWDNPDNESLWNFFHQFEDWHSQMPEPHNGIGVLKYCLYKKGIFSSYQCAKPLSQEAIEYLDKGL